MDEKLQTAIHDIANSLTIIIGNSELLKDHISRNSSEAKRLERIEKSANNIREILAILKA